MRLGKIFGNLLITIGILLVSLQIAWTVSGRSATQQARKKGEPEYKINPYAGIFGVALIVGGIGFVFTTGRRNGHDSSRFVR
jgi:uncharacterized membrane protein